MYLLYEWDFYENKFIDAQIYKDLEKTREDNLFYKLFKEINISSYQAQQGSIIQQRQMNNLPPGFGQINNPPQQPGQMEYMPYNQQFDKGQIPLNNQQFGPGQMP